MYISLIKRKSVINNIDVPALVRDIKANKVIKSVCLNNRCKKIKNDL